MKTRKIIIRKGQHLAGLRVDLAGVVVPFCRAYLRSGDRCMAAPLPADAKAAKAVVHHARRSGGRYLVGSASQIESWIDTPDGHVEEPEFSAGRTLADLGAVQVPAPIRAALQWGWSDLDLEGAGKGEQWGSEGGRADRTGLTVAEMALVPPPAEWADRHEAVWPWELDGWTSPGKGWVPPRVPAKGEKGEKADDEKAGDDEGAGNAEKADGDTSPTDEKGSDAEKAGESFTDADADAELLAEALTADQLAQARQVFTDLLVQGGGERPHHNKLNYHLRKLDLPTLKVEQIDALERALRA